VNCVHGDGFMAAGAIWLAADGRGRKGRGDGPVGGFQPREDLVPLNNFPIMV
jgi:hypothetical protein